MKSAIIPKVTGLRLETYEAIKGAKRVDGRASTARNEVVELRDSKGVVLTRTMGSHDQAKRVAREWVA